jgi:DNA-binding MarR family transcriptional regulator
MSLSEQPYRLTHKQRLVMELIYSGDPRTKEPELDIDQLMEEVEARGTPATKQAMQSTLRILISRDLVSKRPKSLRRGRWRPTYMLKERGRKLLFGGIVMEGEPPALD